MPRWWSKRRFDLLELCLLLAFSSYCVWRAAVFVVGVPREAAWFLRSYGPSHYSRGIEELIIRDFFADKRGGFFVDVGAGHYRTDSNTFYLEEHLGWSGIAIDPLREFEADYRRYRPRTRFFAVLVSDVPNEHAEMFVSRHLPEMSSTNFAFAEGLGGSTFRITVPAATLTSLLTREKVTHIDLLSMDVELSEAKALAGFDIDTFKPALVCIEARPEVRQQILAYFATHGYVLIGKYLRADPVNLYFTPFG